MYYRSGTVVHTQSQCRLTRSADSRRTLSVSGGRTSRRHLESVTSYYYFVNRCVFTLWTILPNFIPIRFETTEP